MKTSIWFSWVIFVVAIVALCVAIARCEPITADWASILVGFLGVIVTALVGWQVFNAIEMRGIIDKVNNVKAELNNIADEHRDKISRLECLVSALHGTTFDRKTFEGGDPSYFRHCLTVIASFIKSGESLDSPPFRNMLYNAETTIKDIKERNDSHEIIVLGGDKEHIQEWYQAVIETIDTEAQHLNDVKKRLCKIYEDYIILTKNVVKRPHKSDKGTSQNSTHKSCPIVRMIKRLLGKTENINPTEQ